MLRNNKFCDKQQTSYAIKRVQKKTAFDVEVRGVILMNVSTLRELHP